MARQGAVGSCASTGARADILAKRRRTTAAAPVHTTLHTRRMGALGAAFSVALAVMAVGPTGAVAEDALPFPVEETFALASLPGSNRTIHLDFDGAEASDTAWDVGTVSAAPFDLDGDPATFTDDEHRYMQTVWLTVVEDFAPFDVNVTTAEPASDVLDRSGDEDEVYGVRVAIGARTPAFEGGTVGLGCTGCFDAVDDPYGTVQAWVVPQADADALATGLIATHEAGHTLGLRHPFDLSPGDGWQAIMLASAADEPLAQWAQGVTDDGPQDPVEVMASHGVVVRADDHPDGFEDGPASLGTVDDLRAGGIISTPADVDVFEFEAVAGPLDLAILPAAVSPNLDVRAELLDATGALVVFSDPPGSSLPAGLAARITTEVEAGTYYLTVDGVGYDDGLGGGWSDYGSLGQYTIQGSITGPPAVQSISVDPETIVEGGAVTVSGSFTAVGGGDPTGTAIWSDGVETDLVIDAGASTFTTARTFDDDEPSGTSSDTYLVDVTIRTDLGSATATSPEVTVVNAAPLLGTIHVSSTEVRVGESVVVAGTFTDPALGMATEAFVVEVTWSDGVATAATVDGAAGSFSATRSFVAGDLPAGEASVDLSATITLVDDDLGTDSVTSPTVTLFPGDSDGDGVLDEFDRCPATVLPDEPTVELKSNRYVATADGFVAGDGTAGPSLADTGGCSGTQVIELLDLGWGHQRFGITASALDQWLASLG
jgi:hypothetical protein